MTAGGKPEAVVIQVRRYRCRACRAILMVGPRGVVRGRWYSASAIALAFEAYGRGESSVAIRGRVSPDTVVGTSACERWVTLVRWVDAAHAGRLFAMADRRELERRRVAERVALALAGRAGRALGDDLAEAAFAGAAIAG